MTNVLPDWYRVLRYWQDVRGQNGLSFGFIVGATRNPVGNPFSNEGEAKQYSLELYGEITKSPVNGRSAVTFHCPGTVKGTIFHLSTVPGTAAPFEELWDEYGSNIILGKYSAWMGDSDEFNQAEKDWINQALSNTYSDG